MRSVFVLVICSLMVLTGCSKGSYIGEISTSYPVLAVVFESGTLHGEPYSGVVYRKITDPDKLIAGSGIPVLLAYIDDSAFSKNALSFIETLADDFNGSLLVVRIYVEISDNPAEVDKLTGLFGVSVFPFFAVVRNGLSLGSVSGYNAVSEKKVLDIIREAIDQARSD